MQECKSRHEIECTVGVVHISGGILFFKNRDLQREYLANRLTVVQSTPEVYALKGVNLKTKELEGVSIGVNRHKICVANTHVESTDDVTYDVLCERLLDQVRSKSDVPRIVNDFVSHNALQGGRILVSSPGWMYLIEVFKNAFQVQEIETSIAITNNFSLISHQAERPKVREESSVNRLEVASRMIKDISNIGMLKSMLRSHIPGKGELSICNHQQDGGGTESSHIIQIQGDYVGWSSLVGHPCENDYCTVQLFQK
ncbi:MAG: hypothetical protein ISS57_10185 [Anaerolineales bacterium]|nr:hypothetical protein [Anaerolineales bacterium]